MALVLGGRIAEAERAYGWLVGLSAPTAPGTSTTSTAGDRGGQARRQRRAPTWRPASGTTGCSPMTGASSRRCGRWSRRPSTSSRPAAARGEILWARHADGTPWRSPCSPARRPCCHSLRCAIASPSCSATSAPTGSCRRPPGPRHPPPEPDAFAPKHRWAMDWYYPVLGGVRRWATPAAPACRPLGHVRRRGPRRALRQGPPWITVAETCECRWPTSPSASARPPSSCSPGRSSTAPTSTAATGRAPCTPSEAHFPADERSTYTAAAVVLSADALERHHPRGGAFVASPCLFDASTTSCHRRLTAGRSSFVARTSELGDGGSGALEDAERGWRGVRPRNAPRLERTPVDLVRRPAAVGRVGEDVVDGEVPPGTTCGVHGSKSR